MQRIASAWESYYVEHTIYVTSTAQPIQFAWGNISGDALFKMLFSKSKDQQKARDYFIDGWGLPIQFGVWNAEDCETGGLECGYGIRSAGRDGVWDADRYLNWPTGSYDHDRDIVLALGQFVRWPIGGSAIPGPAPIPHHPTWQRVFPYL
jgi:hypothetical protein